MLGELLSRKLGILVLRRYGEDSQLLASCYFPIIYYRWSVIKFQMPLLSFCLGISKFDELTHVVQVFCGSATVRIWFCVFVCWKFVFDFEHSSHCSNSLKICLLIYQISADTCLGFQVCLFFAL